MTRVSIIIPAYNSEKYIEQCVCSALSQTLKDIEIIIIDDGSTDNTGIIIERLVRGCDKVKVIHQNNEGLYKSREIGLSVATGEYVGWIDADDYVDINMYETLYNLAVECDSELVICDYSCFPKALAVKGKWFREYKGSLDTTFVERNSQPWNKIVKRELLERLKIGDCFESCFDEIYIRVLLEAKNPITVKKQLYNYRIGRDTLSTSYMNVAHYRDFVIASKHLRSIMSSVCVDAYWRDYFDYRVSYYLLITMIISANAGDKQSYLANRKELFELQPKYNKNQHWNIIYKNYGILKGSVICAIVPRSYVLARTVCKIGMPLICK